LMREHLRADFAISRSMTYVAQPESALEAVRKVVAAVRAPIPLAALNVMTTIMGSCILGLAVAQRWISVEQGWAAAHVDEDFQIRNWGEDDEAQARRQRRWVDMSAAARLYELTTQV
jgi:chaperone required for assembly of F1-ATPase